MAQRMIEIVVPETSQGAIETALESVPTLGVWADPADEGRVQIRVLIEAGQSETAMEALEPRIADITDARLILTPVEATLPHPSEEDEEESQASASSEAATGDDTGTHRVSLEELYDDVLDMSRLTTMFVVLSTLASIVAAIGMLRNNAAVVIGSMVIAPLLGPSVGLALAGTLADLRLARVSLKASVVGVAAGWIVAFGLGLFVPVDPTIHELALRSAPSLWDVGLGLAVGAAGVLSVTTGISQALVGVMVAVALVPPLVASGLFAGAGMWNHAAGAAVLLVTYLISINLAGVVAFTVQGVRPRNYWDAERAKRSTIAAVVLWTLLLAALAFVIWKSPAGQVGRLLESLL